MAQNLLHFDEARDGALRAARDATQADPTITAVVIVDDLYGRVSLVVWLSTPAQGSLVTDALSKAFAAACAQYWSGTIMVSPASSPENDDDLLRHTAWAEGRAADDKGVIRINDRHRHHSGWFSTSETQQALWPLEAGPPIIVFYGFKGGAGRTTLLASHALACAQRGQRVAVVDFDLDAPGVGLLLAADEEALTARWGTIDFLIEGDRRLPLSDYFHLCPGENLAGDGALEIFPAGRLDDGYLEKLARVDLEIRGDVRTHSLTTLLTLIRAERKPDVILLDGRAGLSPAAGLLLSGIAHLHVVVATSNTQSIAGLERVVRHLGFEQARHGLPQRECIVVQALVPDNTEVAALSRESFATKVEQIFVNGYYATDAADDDRTWSIRDLESGIAPHVPVAISYRGRLAHFQKLDDVADLLVKDNEYSELHRRIDERLAKLDAKPAAQEVEDA